MARARFIRPEFFTDVKLADLSFGACMLFAGIWCHSDLRGVFEHDPRALRGLIFPMRDGIDTATVGKWLAELESIGCVGRFEADGKAWGFVRKWTEHQTISGREKEIGSTRPHPPNDTGTTQGRHGDDTGTTRVATPTPTPTPTPTTTTTTTTTRTSAESSAAAAADEHEIQTEGLPIIRNPTRSQTLADLQNLAPSLLIRSEEREQAGGLIRLYGWDACLETAKELSQEARRKPGKNRVFIDQFASGLAARYALEPDDYRRAGLQVPAGK
jgi:hypothetical protein